MVYSRLARRLRELRPDRFRCVLRLPVQPAGRERGSVLLVNALTTNLTRFYREPHHFEHLAKVVLPQVQASQSKVTTKPRLRIWSAGMSSGEEPYTIAMTVLATLPDINRWDARILATDIDTHMVETAKRGLYAADNAKAIPAAIRERSYLKPAAGNAGRCSR